MYRNKSISSYHTGVLILKHATPKLKIITIIKLESNKQNQEVKMDFFLKCEEKGRGNM